MLGMTPDQFLAAQGSKGGMAQIWHKGRATGLSTKVRAWPARHCGHHVPSRRGQPVCASRRLRAPHVGREPAKPLRNRPHLCYFTTLMSVDHAPCAARPSRMSW
jgi:hypothetical protein